MLSRGTLDLGNFPLNRDLGWVSFWKKVKRAPERNAWFLRPLKY